MIGTATLLLSFLFLTGESEANRQDALYRSQQQQPPSYRRQACPNYRDYATRLHPPYSTGKYRLPFQRPVEECRLYNSPAVESLIAKMNASIKDKDLARLFENCFPNTLDTTVRWHLNADKVADKQSFIVTGDINAQWLRDSTNQLAQYQLLAKDDEALRNLILGAINTQADFVLQSPYCNAFQPPKASGLAPTSNGQDDTVHPVYDNTVVFECKYEIDSLASFLSLGNQYYNHTGDLSFVGEKWLSAVDNVMALIEEQQVSTFSNSGSVQSQVYTFQRKTTLGTETLNLAGIGNPINHNTSLVRSAFRPSDDATIMQFFIPGNAMLAVELKRTAEILKKVKQTELATFVQKKGEAIEAGVWKHGVVTHPVFGEVFAYEVDGYSSHIIMDDANLPSLLALPVLGFVDVKNQIYQNTRKMILSREGNPYFLTGTEFKGIGGPHIGITHAWPISLLIEILTTDDDDEILALLGMSVNVERVKDYTRSWFAWANSLFAQTILDLAHRKPQILFSVNGGR
ncbi:hypothetical protein L873DRAFT_1667279 [Choiromyces venosus 120613-1]|uniref:DUF1237-domain-containing protein n=1 Tax=Choiromyces venosus 120613-1 TaxID=1336337 RepID=A0A3N4K0Y2_9PEZI|nr:hypothetical protein L873DRAFT_1667279 [Choiromyces venosus 120613-1]